MTIRTWMREQETHYAAHLPHFLANYAMDIPLRPWPLYANGVLAETWKAEAVQLKIYDIILDMGLTTKWPSLIQRMVDGDLGGTLLPCLSLVVHGPPVLFQHAANSVYDYLMGEIGSQDFMVEVYNEANMTDYCMYPITKDQTDAIGGDYMVSHLRHKVIGATVSTPVALDGLSSIGVRRMMPLRSGKRPPAMKENDLSDPAESTLMVTFRGGTVADFDGLQRRYVKLLRTEGLEEKVRVRLFEDRQMLDWHGGLAMQ
ncbi:hypothetical protein LTR36_005963 [Oleoguttula mirabilis]|uniref:Uncharacterized protein n=1 Tax=Oleoguttula mirabilis TaxID=1507867 RepID=A0AAV9JCW3_9PEZI|nr:hypothetical protein LTR36_005963 [Oleoguttula mirabilis]